MKASSYRGLSSGAKIRLLFCNTHFIRLQFHFIFLCFRTHQKKRRKVRFEALTNVRKLAIADCFPYLCGQNHLLLILKYAMT